MLTDFSSCLRLKVRNGIVFLLLHCSFQVVSLPQRPLSLHLPLPQASTWCPEMLESDLVDLSVQAHWWLLSWLLMTSPWNLYGSECECVAEDQIYSLLHVNQVLYHWAIPLPSKFVVFTIGNWTAYFNITCYFEGWFRKIKTFLKVQTLQNLSQLVQYHLSHKKTCPLIKVGQRKTPFCLCFILSDLLYFHLRLTGPCFKHRKNCFFAEATNSIKCQRPWVHQQNQVGNWKSKDGCNVWLLQWFW